MASSEEQAGALARQAHRVSGELRALVAVMAEQGWQPDGQDLPFLLGVADAIGGMAVRAGMESGDPAVMADVLGKPGQFLTIDDVIPPGP